MYQGNERRLRGLKEEGRQCSRNYPWQKMRVISDLSRNKSLLTQRFNSVEQIDCSKICFIWCRSLEIRPSRAIYPNWVLHNLTPKLSSGTFGDVVWPSLIVMLNHDSKICHCVYFRLAISIAQDLAHAICVPRSNRGI